MALVLCAVFVPCAFLGGVTGQFFRQFAVTIAVSTIISAVNALTMTPSRAVLIFKTEQGTCLLYTSLAERLKGFSRTGPSKLFRKFVDTSGDIEITEKGVIVRLSKRAHNPLLKEAGMTEPTQPVPWLRGRSVRLVCP